MTQEEAERALAAAGASPDHRFPMFEAALSCALHEDPNRDPGPARALAAEAANLLAVRMKRQRPEDAICDALGADLDLHGDVFAHYEAADADIISVCERRKGLPVALGVIYLEAARRCKLQVCGVDFPGHFLLRIETDQGPMALDPMAGGRVVMPSELTKRALQMGLTPNAADRMDSLMAPVADRMVILRLQNNIFARAAHARDYVRAERSALRRALLDPTDHRPWLDVAAAREGMGHMAGALQALTQAQVLDGGAALAARVARERLRRALN
jgi:regulator of sirC expression with transglutaminase-like and TPR domain